MTEPLGILVVMVGLAFLVETLTEAVFGPLFDKLPVLTPHKWALMYVALVVGVVGALVYNFDLLAVLSVTVGMEHPIETGVFGMIITGLAIGKGSNYLHQFISKFFPAKT
jgi:hypothetical protein